MKSAAVFPRTGCTLLDGLDLRQEQFCETSVSTEVTISTTLDVKIRNAGWHFMWSDDAYSCHGVGPTKSSAIAKAIIRTLSQVNPHLGLESFAE